MADEACAQVNEDHRPHLFPRQQSCHTSSPSHWKQCEAFRWSVQKLVWRSECFQVPESSPGRWIHFVDVEVTHVKSSFLTKSGSQELHLPAVQMLHEISAPVKDKLKLWPREFMERAGPKVPMTCHAAQVTLHGPEFFSWNVCKDSTFLEDTHEV